MGTGGIIVAPGEPLRFQSGVARAHQFSVSIPLR
jgi:hypothetical protein